MREERLTSSDRSGGKCLRDMNQQSPALSPDRKSLSHSLSSVLVCKCVSYLCELLYLAPKIKLLSSMPDMKFYDMWTWVWVDVHMSAEGPFLEKCFSVLRPGSGDTELNRRVESEQGGLEQGICSELTWIDCWAGALRRS